MLSGNGEPGLLEICLRKSPIQVSPPPLLLLKQMNIVCVCVCTGRQQIWDNTIVVKQYVTCRVVLSPCGPVWMYGACNTRERIGRGKRGRWSKRHGIFLFLNPRDLLDAARVYLDDIDDPGVQQIVGACCVVLHQLSVPDVRLAVHPRPLCVKAQISARIFEFVYPPNNLSIPRKHQEKIMSSNRLDPPRLELRKR